MCQFFLFSTSTQVPPVPLFHPGWTSHLLGPHPNCAPHPGAFISFKLACLSFNPCQLLSQTNKIWLANHPEDKCGTAYNLFFTKTLSQWATHQLLAAHLVSHRYSQHLSTSIATIVNYNHQCHATHHISPILLSSLLPHTHISSDFRNSELVPMNFYLLPFSHHPPHS